MRHNIERERVDENIARNKKQIVQSKKQIIRKQHKTHGGIEISFDCSLKSSFMTSKKSKSSKSLLIK